MRQTAAMSTTMNWPTGEFTLQELIQLNPQFAEAAIRQALANGRTAKKIVQTQKGDKKVKGKFKVVAPL
jgi:hypothetical protein